MDSPIVGRARRATGACTQMMLGEHERVGQILTTLDAQELTALVGKLELMQGMCVQELGRRA